MTRVYSYGREFSAVYAYYYNTLHSEPLLFMHYLAKFKSLVTSPISILPAAARPHSYRLPIVNCRLFPVVSQIFSVNNAYKHRRRHAGRVRRTKHQDRLTFFQIQRVKNKIWSRFNSILHSQKVLGLLILSIVLLCFECFHCCNNY